MKQICENCTYWQYEDIDKGHVCVNDNSYYLAEWTDKNCTCEEYKQKHK